MILGYFTSCHGIAWHAVYPVRLDVIAEASAPLHVRLLARCASGTLSSRDRRPLLAISDNGLGMSWGQIVWCSPVMHRVAGDHLLVTGSEILCRFYLFDIILPSGCHLKH